MVIIIVYYYYNSDILWKYMHVLTCLVSCIQLHFYCSQIPCPNIDRFHWHLKRLNGIMISVFNMNMLKYAKFSLCLWYTWVVVEKFWNRLDLLILKKKPKQNPKWKWIDQQIFKWVSCITVTSYNVTYLYHAKNTRHFSSVTFVMVHWR